MIRVFFFIAPVMLLTILRISFKGDSYLYEIFSIVTNVTSALKIIERMVNTFSSTANVREKTKNFIQNILFSYEKCERGEDGGRKMPQKNYDVLFEPCLINM